MNFTIFETTLRQRFASKTRMLLVGVVFVFPIALAMMASEIGLQTARTGSVYAFLLGAGILGQETSSGVMQLLFARPVRRWHYVMSRWLAIVVASSALVVLQILVVCLAVASHGLPSAKEIAVMIAEQVLQAAGTASVILFFSSFLSGVGDVLGIVMTVISAQVLNGIGALRQSEALTRTGTEIMRFINPQLAIGPMLSGNGMPWFDIVSYFSTIALCVAVAVLLLNRREISYASE